MPVAFPAAGIFFWASDTEDAAVADKRAADPGCARPKARPSEGAAAGRAVPGEGG